jgi:Transposase DDE domain group 1
MVVNAPRPPQVQKGIRVNAIITKRMAARKRRLERRLDKHNYPEDSSRPMLRSRSLQYELAGRAAGTVYGGVGLVQELVRQLGLAEAIDRRLHVFKVHLPYHESDHVLNLAYNALCAGTCLEDLELRRQDEAYLNLLGAERIPDPTTAGDFCRRFERSHLGALQAAYDVARLQVWREQPAAFFAEARIEADGTLVETAAECKRGVDINYQGRWGYHPLVLTLANTGEVLRLINRSGSRPSHEGAPALFDECIALCRAAGFRRILLRGDTDFSQTEHLDRWHAQGDVRFVFGLDVTPGRHVQVDDLPAAAWKPLKRPPKYAVRTQPRARPKRVKQRIVEQREFKDIRLVDEEVAETPYRPVACQRAYRLVIVRKNLQVSEPKQGRLFDDYRYFFYLTNDWESTAEKIVFSANDRCQQENVLAQLSAARALHAPVDNLLSNEAYMLMTALAWNLKAWLALSLPENMPRRPAAKKGRRRAPSQPSDKQRLLGLEFRTFVNYFLRLPAQVVKTGRRIVVRLLAYNAWQPVFFRLTARFARPRRC